MIDLKTKFGFWGKSGLVDVPEVTLFAFRKGQIAPSPVVDHPGVPAKPEPITPSVDPRTEEGLLLRQQFLHFWSRHALALGVAPIEGTPFTSTWDEVIATWGDVYHK